MTRERVQVVAGVLADPRGRVLIERRPAHVHLGGLWEFPGGKLEPGEDRRAGLSRELAEELGIRALRMSPLIRVRHDYPDRAVVLDVWRVERWSGEVRAREGQPLRWVAPGDLDDAELPAADRPVLRALALPDACLVTPPPGADPRAWLDALARAVTAGVELVQVRAPGLPRQQLLGLSRAAVARCREADPRARVLVNADAALALEAGACGVQLDSRRLWQARRRPLPPGMLVGASCHDAADLARAAALDLDLALLGPVAPTPTHPGAVALGWECFAALAERARLPVYALGGMTASDLDAARGRGGQGIAAIRGLWPAGPGGGG